MFGPSSSVVSSPNRYHTPIPSLEGVNDPASACKAPGPIEITVRGDRPTWLTGDEIKALADAGFGAADRAEYDALRIRLGLADGSRDMEVEKAILRGARESIDYMNREVTASIKETSKVFG